MPNSRNAQTVNAQLATYANALWGQGNWKATFHPDTSKRWVVTCITPLPISGPRDYEMLLLRTTSSTAPIMEPGGSNVPPIAINEVEAETGTESDVHLSDKIERIEFTNYEWLTPDELYEIGFDLGFGMGREQGSKEQRGRDWATRNGHNMRQ